MDFLRPALELEWLYSQNLAELGINADAEFGLHKESFQTASENLDNLENAAIKLAANAKHNHGNIALELPAMLYKNGLNPDNFDIESGSFIASTLNPTGESNFGKFICMTGSMTLAHLYELLNVNYSFFITPNHIFLTLPDTKDNKGVNLGFSEKAIDFTKQKPIEKLSDKIRNHKRLNEIDLEYSNQRYHLTARQMMGLHANNILNHSAAKVLKSDDAWMQSAKFMLRTAKELYPNFPLILDNERRIAELERDIKYNEQAVNEMNFYKIVKALFRKILPN